MDCNIADTIGIWNWLADRIWSDLHPDAVVFRVDFGEPDDANLVLYAAEFDGLPGTPGVKRLTEIRSKPISRAYVFDVLDSYRSAA